MAEISYDEFCKVELVAGTITEAEKIAGSDRLFRLSVDMGTEKCTLVAGVAQHYAPEALLGRQVIVVANLAPRALRGIISQGMLLAADMGEGKMSILSPDCKVPNGARVR